MPKNIVISGGGKGIGKALALKFAEMGCNVAVCARTQSDLETLMTEMLQLNPACNIIVSVTDVRSKVDLKKFADEVIDKWGTVDVLVNNAGTFIPGLVTEEPDGNLELLMETNLYSAYYLSRYLLSALTASAKANIFNVTSVAGIKAYPNGGSYSISKFAMLGLSKALREELKSNSIAVTSLIPGATLTDSWAGSGLPEDRFMTVNDVADLVYNISCMSAQTVVEEVVLRPMLGDI